MTNRLSDVLRALVVVSIALSVMTAGAIAAAPSVSTSTTDDTSTTSELQSGSTIAGFQANSSNETVIQYQADSNDTKLEIHETDGDQVYSNATPENIFWNSTDSDGHYNVSLNHAELADVEYAINDNVTLNVTMINDSTLDSPDKAYFEFYLETDNTRTVDQIDDAQVDSESGIDVFEGEEKEIAGFNYTDGDDFAEYDDERSIDGTNTSVVLVFQNDTVLDDFSKATDDTSLLDPRDESAEDGDLLLRSAALVEDTAVPIFYNEVPDGFDDDERTYGIYSEDIGGATGITIHLADDVVEDDDTNVDIQVFGGTGFTKALMTYGAQTTIFGVDGISGALSLSIVPIAFVIGAVPRGNSSSSSERE